MRSSLKPIESSPTTVWRPSSRPICPRAARRRDRSRACGGAWRRWCRTTIEVRSSQRLLAERWQGRRDATTMPQRWEPPRRLRAALPRVRPRRACKCSARFSGHARSSATYRASAQRCEERVAASSTRRAVPSSPAPAAASAAPSPSALAEAGLASRWCGRDRDKLEETRRRPAASRRAAPAPILVCDVTDRAQVGGDGGRGAGGARIHRHPGVRHRRQRPPAQPARARSRPTGTA